MRLAVVLVWGLLFGGAAIAPAQTAVNLSRGQQAPTPWLAIDRIPLADLPVTAGDTLTWTLGQVPIDGSALLAILQGRPFGLVEAAVVAGRQVTITLPARPFGPADVVVLVYLTTDTRPAPVRR